MASQFASADREIEYLVSEDAVQTCTLIPKFQRLTRTPPGTYRFLLVEPTNVKTTINVKTHRSQMCESTSPTKM